MPRREPPVLFTPEICADPKRLAKSLQMVVDHLSQEVDNAAVDQNASLTYLADTMIDEGDMDEIVTSTITSELPHLGDGEAPAAPSAAPIITPLFEGLEIDMSAYSPPVDFQYFWPQVSYNAGTDWSDLSLGTLGVVTFNTNEFAVTHRFKFKVTDIDGNVSAFGPASADYYPLSSSLTYAAEDQINTDETRNNATYGDLTTVGPRVWIQAPASRQVLIFNTCSIWSNTGSETARQSYEVKHVTGDGSTTAGAEGVTHAAADSNAAVVTNPERIKSADINRLYLTTAGNWYMITAKYQRDGAAASHFAGRQLVVFPL